MKATPLQRELTEDLSIEELVREDNWRAVLVELIVSNKLDPWTVDVEKLASSFVEKLEEITAEGFEVPSNIVLACAILLKFKSLSLRIQEPEELPEVDAPPLEEDALPLRYSPRMPITLKEIVKAVEKTLKKIEKPLPKRSQERVEIQPTIEIEEENIQEEVSALYERLRAIRKTYLSHLVKDDPAEITRTLLGLLFLSNEEKVALYQQKVFEDIEVRVLAEEAH